MGCEFCSGVGFHSRRCPAYVPEKAKHYCCFCEDGIYCGQDYIKNHKDEYAHWDCIDDTRDLAEWLDVEVKIMDDD